MFGQGAHVASSLPPAQISPVILVCPLRMHPRSFCSWLGFQNDRHEHLDAVRRDCLVRGISVDLRVDGLCLLSALNKIFLCYTLPDMYTLYCVVQLSCWCKACNSEFYYVTEVTDAFTGKTVTSGAAVATMFQMFKFLKDTHGWVSYCGVDEEQSVKFFMPSPSGHRYSSKFKM